jgi:DNA-binding response OmpR family regulator
MLTILAVGKDMPLLATRAAVLRQAGAQVEVTAPSGWAAMMESRPYDVLVLCHSLSKEETEAITEKVGRQWAGVRILLMVQERCAEPPMRGVAAISTPEPRRLVSRVKALLAGRPERVPVEISRALGGRLVGIGGAIGADQAGPGLKRL